MNQEEKSSRKTATVQKSFTNKPQSSLKVTDKPHLNSIHIEHSYSINPNSLNETNQSVPEASKDNADTVLPTQKHLEVLVVNGRTIELKRCKRAQHSLLKTSSLKKPKLSSNEELAQTNTVPFFNRISLPEDNFYCVIEALPFLFKRLPLIVSYSNYLKYKCMYPYVANSFEEFSKWSTEKRCSSEVSFV